MNPFVALLEDAFAEPLRQFAAELTKSFPRWNVGLESSSLGAATDYQGHMLGISCLAPDMPLDRVDHVALCLEIGHVTTEPYWSGAYVCWGHPSGHVEADILSSEVPFDANTIKEISLKLPILLSSLAEALRREYPSDENA